MSWIVLPRPMSSASTPPRPRSTISFIQARPRRWYGRSVASRPSGSTSSWGAEAASSRRARSAVAPPTSTSTTSPSISAVPLSAATSASVPDKVSRRPSLATTVGSTTTHSPRRRTSGRRLWASADSSLSFSGSPPSTPRQESSQALARSNSAGPSPAPGGGSTWALASSVRVSAEGMRTSTPAPARSVASGPKRSMASWSSSSRDVGQGSASSRPSGGHSRAPRRRASSRSVSASGPKPAASPSHSAAASITSEGSMADRSCRSMPNGSSGSLGMATRSPTMVRSPASAAGRNRSRSATSASASPAQARNPEAMPAAAVRGSESATAP